MSEIQFNLPVHLVLPPDVKYYMLLEAMEPLSMSSDRVAFTSVCIYIVTSKSRRA